jgi:hypothetical protein
MRNYFLSRCLTPAPRLKHSSSSLSIALQLQLHNRARLSRSRTPSSLVDRKLINLVINYRRLDRLLTCFIALWTLNSESSHCELFNGRQHFMITEVVAGSYRRIRRPRRVLLHSRSRSLPLCSSLMNDIRLRNETFYCVSSSSSPARSTGRPASVCGAHLESESINSPVPGLLMGPMTSGEQMMT